MEGLTEGRIVHYVLPYGPSQGQHRPAIVVKVWNKETGLCQLQVFTDSDTNGLYNDQCGPVLWATSILPDESGEKVGTWHWIERA